MIAIIAVLCAVADPSDCHSEIVTTQAPMFECLLGRDLAGWMRDRPQFTLSGWRCVVGEKRRDA